jgi:DNA-directed RNA polymerase subunit RPC12/RpoP
MTKYFCNECNSLSEYSDLITPEEHNPNILCIECTGKIFMQWQKEDNIPGGGIIFKLQREKK